MTDWKAVTRFEPDKAFLEAAKGRISELGIPRGSLGRLHEIAIQMAAIKCNLHIDLERCLVAVFAADHGVSKHSVSAFDRSITDANTRRMAEGTATISVMSKAVGSKLCVIDVGVDAERYDESVRSEFKHEFIDRKVTKGTADICAAPAMSRSELEAAISAGFEIVSERSEDIDVLIIGEMGIGNTTSASALSAFLLGLEPHAVTGIGSGIGEKRLAHKRRIVAEAVRRASLASNRDDPLEALRQLGGLEIAAMVGAFAGAAKHRIPVILDGFIVSSAFLVAGRLIKGLEHLVFPGTRSTEKAMMS